jgi:hypothetical protein
VQSPSLSDIRRDIPRIDAALAVPVPILAAVGGAEWNDDHRPLVAAVAIAAWGAVAVSLVGVRFIGIDLDADALSESAAGAADYDSRYQGSAQNCTHGSSPSWVMDVTDPRGRWFPSGVGGTQEEARRVDRASRFSVSSSSG